MSEPLNNLTAKFAALQELMSTQHQALLAKIDDLRGSGPENTIKSVNQSIWNMVGPAPGANLVQIFDKLTRINNGLGGYPDGVTLPGGTPVLSAREYLGQIVNSTSYLSLILDATGYTGDVSILNQLSLLLEQFNTSIAQPTMKDLAISTLSTMEQLAACCEENSDPLMRLPAGICASPFASTGIIRISVTANLVEPTTVATWPTVVPSGFPGITTLSGGIATGQTRIQCDDWTQYKIFVASKASLFGLDALSLQKFDTNRWIVLNGNETFDFTTIGEDNLKVYICPIGGALGSCPGSEDPRQISSWQATYKGITATRDWEMVDSSGGTTWSTIEQIRLETPAATPQAAIRITRTITTVGLCIAWDVSGESDTVQEIGIRAFTEDVGYWGEVGLTVAPVVIAMSGASGSLIREFNLSGGYTPDDFSLIPYVYYAASHTTQPNVSVAISFVELTAS